MCIYQLGRSDDLIYYLFVDYPPMNINWASPMIHIFSLDYPPTINILDYPPNHFL